MNQSELYERMPESFHVGEFTFNRYGVSTGKSTAQIGYDMRHGNMYFPIIANITPNGHVEWTVIGIREKANRYVPLSTRMARNGEIIDEYPIYQAGCLDRDENIPRASAEKLVELLKSGQIEDWV